MSNDISKDLDRITTLLVVFRAASGMSQRVLAEKAGLSVDVVKTIESGRHKPNFTTLVCLARALGYRIDLVPIEVDE